MTQTLSLSQEQTIELTHLNPLFSAQKTQLATASAFTIEKVELEINSPENITLEMSFSNSNNNSDNFITKAVEFKKYKQHFIFRDNKHVLETSKTKDFRFDISKTPLKEIKVTSYKYPAFKITLYYSAEKGQ